MWFASWSSQIQCNECGLRRGPPKSNATKSNVTILLGLGSIQSKTKKRRKKKKPGDRQKATDNSCNEII